MSVVLLGVGLLVCNALLGSMGLVARTGHDAMHKAAANPHTSSGAKTNTSHNDTFADDVLLVESFNASLHWLSSGLQHTQDFLAPALCVLIFPFVLLGGFHNSNNTGAAQCKKQEASAFGNRAVEILVWLAYIAIALLWLCQGQDLGHKSLLSCLPTDLPIKNLLTAPLIEDLVGTLLTQSFNVLLPKLCFVFLITSVVMCTMFCVKCANQDCGCVSIAILVAPVLLVLGTNCTLASVLALLECVCVKQLFYSLAVSEQQSFKNPVIESKALVRADSWMTVAEGSTWALISAQLFFCTGHFCEFAGLQYTAGKCCAHSLPPLLCW